MIDGRNDQKEDQQSSDGHQSNQLEIYPNKQGKVEKNRRKNKRVEHLAEYQIWNERFVPFEYRAMASKGAHDKKLTSINI